LILETFLSDKPVTKTEVLYGRVSKHSGGVYKNNNVKWRGGRRRGLPNDENKRE